MEKQFLILLLLIAGFLKVSGQNIPLVYSVENTGAECPQPKLLSPDQLPAITRLPNPFEWSDRSGSIGSFSDWRCRRAEIKAEIEHYEIGIKPNRPENITAKYSDDTLTVTIEENGKTLILKSPVNIPDQNGPFPIIIGMNRPTGSLSPSHFEKCIQIPFIHNQVATYNMKGQKDMEAPFYQMYPELSSNGDYCAWAWGISRLIDGLEIVADEINADLEHVAVSGCSYAGKMALFAGAFDERIALTIAQEPGGGGAASWRVSETIGEVEKISNTSYTWFMPALKTHFDGQVEKLPYDHHELMAMIAPRALLVLGNDGWTWLADESGYVSCMAAREVWKYMGIADRFGFDFSGNHGHCQACDSQNAAIASFVDKFLYGNTKADTNVLIYPHRVDHQQWLEEW